MTSLPTALVEKLRMVLESFPEITLGAVFGSIATGTAQPHSDIDVAVQAARPLTTDQKMSIIEAIALAFDRPVDLVDLRTVGQPLLHEIIAGGIQVVGTRKEWGDLMFRNIMENEDFVPYQQRILEGRRKAWIDS